DRRYRRRVIHFADYLNRKFGNRNWRPVELASAKMPACDLKQFYRDGDIYFIADMNDGMNPEAMAYTVAQNPADPGGLLISRDTGAAQFPAAALQFNPADMASVLRQLKAAVTMSEFERISRWRQIIQWIDSLASSRRDTAGLPAENRFGEKA